ncbi:MAG: hypothetical protein MUF00_05805 [Gemmatimonadaceae bacterium]|jgi:hypothetical protein|nr:hypothetical protein [Gemmatimonadaceae bacterium]
MSPESRAAHEILAMLEATYQPTHRFVPAHPRSFRHLDQRWYDRAARTLEQRGFKRLGDLEDRTITEAGGVLSPAMIRTLRSSDGAVAVSLYHARIRSFPLRALFWVLRQLPGTIIDCETECTDGSFVVTSTAPASTGALEMPALISSRFLPKGTTVESAVAQHEARITAHLAHRPGVTARRVTTSEELIAMQNRLNALKSAYRGEIGGVTRDELDRLAPAWARGVAGDVHAAIEVEQWRRAS